MEDFVPFEIAKKLKEKGFTCEYPFAMYDVVGIFYALYTSAGYYNYYEYRDFDEHDCIAPTISQALKWLEKEKKVFIDTKTHIDLNGNYHFSYSIIFNGKQERQDYTFFDWERIDAYITAIDYALDNIIT